MACWRTGNTAKVKTHIGVQKPHSERSVEGYSCLTRSHVVSKDQPRNAAEKLKNSGTYTSG